MILSFSVQTGHCGLHLAKAAGGAEERGEKMKREKAQISPSLSPSALSPWCTHVNLEQGCVLARGGHETESIGGGVCMCVCVCQRGIKGHAASIAEQVQGLIGSGNGWSM